MAIATKKRTGITFKMTQSGKIVMHHNWRKQRKQYPVHLPYDIKPNNWDGVKEQFWHPDNEIHSALNKTLSKYHDAMRTTEKQMWNVIEPEVQDIARLFNSNLGMVSPDDITLYDELEGWIKAQDIINAERKKAGSEKRHKDYPRYTMLRQALKSYDEQIKAGKVESQYKVKIKMVDSDYIESFKNALVDGLIHSKRNKPYSQRSKVGAFTAFNRFIKDSLRKYKLGYAKIDDYDGGGVDQYYKNLFLILCLTGARYKDGQHFDERIISGNCIKYTESKRGNSINIFATSNLTGSTDIVNHGIGEDNYNELIELLQRIRVLKDKYYKPECTVGHNGNVFRGNIRRLLKRAGIIKEMNLGNGKFCEKWEAAGNHTGRNSFIYYHVQAGMRFKDIKTLCGHGDIGQTEDYYDRIKV